MNFGEFVRRLMALVIVISFCGLSGCGTDTGNPGEELYHSDLGENPNGYLYTMIESSCQKLISCGVEVSLEACWQGLLKQNNVMTILGIDDGVHTMQDGLVMEASKEITPVSEKSGQCIESVKAMDCELEKVWNSYRPENENPFLEYRNFLPRICQGSMSYTP